MRHLRRCHALFLERTETVTLDPLALLQGDSGLATTLGWRALTAHLPDPVALDDAEVAALARFGATVWITQAQAERHTPPDLIDRLLTLGLLVSVDADGPCGDAARADAQLRADAWHPLNAVAHRASRWSNTDATASLRRAQFDAVSAMVADHGPPPAECPDRTDRLERHALPRHADSALDALLQQRVTCRNFDRTRPLTQAQLGETLGRVFGVRGEETLAPGAIALKKNHPSGGSLHPYEAYVLVRAVDGLASGLYHYAARAHALDLLRPMPCEAVDALVLTAVAGQDFFADAPAHVVLAARFPRSQWKYRNHPKVLRVLLIEAGHIAQNWYLSATAQGLGAYITAAINEVQIEQALGLDPLREGPIAVCGLGLRAPERRTVEFDPNHRIWPAT